MLKHMFQLIMDDKVNPLRRLPVATRFQLMTALAYMWCTIFCTIIGSYAFFGMSVALHVLVLVGISVTAYFFRNAESGRLVHVKSYRDVKDVGTKYDDIWGAR